ADHARLHTGMEGLPASAVADAARRQLEEGTFEVYVPESFKGMFSTRAADVASNIAFTADWARRQFGDGPPAP
ncbi:MAG TPA: hypothetical protein VMU14_07980, partial [Acidimicrobiales bacterium]|nr:hypothetical protein [Acidimicrobiales bacterium]